MDTVKNDRAPRALSPILRILLILSSPFCSNLCDAEQGYEWNMADKMNRVDRMKNGGAP
jgi:hypothetical protein